VRLEGRRRRIRIRRKRNRKGIVRETAEEGAAQVLYEAGRCIIEAVVAASVLVAMLSIPAHLMFG
jgi:hypothetical protein